MLVSHTKKFIFTKTSKTAGTSVEMYFEKYCFDNLEYYYSTEGRKQHVGKNGIIGYRGPLRYFSKWYNHMPAYKIKKYLNSKIWNEYYKFTVIRNPYSKMVSAFRYFEKVNKNRKGLPKLIYRLKILFRITDDLFKQVAHIDNDKDRFKEWVKLGGYVDDRDAYTINDEIVMDYFIKYEDLENGIKEVCDKLNISFEIHKIPKTKVNSNANNLDIKSYYDKETLEIVSKIYKKEIDLFNYTLEGI